MRWGPALTSSEVAAFERRAQRDRSVEKWDCCHSPAGISNSEILWMFKGAILKHSKFRPDGYTEMVMRCTRVRLLGPLWHSLVCGFGEELVKSWVNHTSAQWLRISEFKCQLWSKSLSHLSRVKTRVWDSLAMTMKIDEYIFFFSTPVPVV